MNLDKIPDPQKQFLCRKCRQWLDHNEMGGAIINNRFNFSVDLGLFISFAKSITGVNNGKGRVICKKCYSKRKLNRFLLGFSFVALVLWKIISTWENIY